MIFNFFPKGHAFFQLPSNAKWVPHSSFNNFFFKYYNAKLHFAATKQSSDFSLKHYTISSQNNTLQELNKAVMLIY